MDEPACTLGGSGEQGRLVALALATMELPPPDRPTVDWQTAANMSQRYGFSDLPRAVQVQLAGIGPLLFGAVVGFMLGESEVGYWVLTGLSVVGGVAGGLDHPELRAAAARGLVAGALFGSGIVAAQAGRPGCNARLRR